MEAPELERQRRQFREQLRHALGIHAELLRAASHLHARGLEFEIRVHAHRDLRSPARAACDVGETPHLELGFHVDHYRGGDRALELGWALAGPGEAHELGTHAGRECHVHFACRGYVDPVHEAAEMPHDGRHRVGLHGVVDLDPGRKRSAQFLCLARHDCAVVGVEGRAAKFVRDRRDLSPADQQFAILRVEVWVRRVLREIVEHDYCGVKVVLNCAARAGRSNLPFGLRGSSGSQARWCGTMKFGRLAFR